MNARSTPHIGATLAQRAILRYRLEQRELEAERERFERTTAALQVDALLDRVSQPDPCNFCAPAEPEAEPFNWIDSVAFLCCGAFVAAVILVISWAGWLS